MSVADLIAYREAREKLVERVGEFPVASPIGTLQGFAYVTPFDPQHHMAFVHGRIGDGRNVPARLHRADVIGDVFGGAKTINATLGPLQGRGARRAGLSARRHRRRAGRPRSRARDKSSDAVRVQQWREIGLGAQILKDLGISSIRLLASKKHTYVGLGGFGIEIVVDRGG